MINARPSSIPGATSPRWTAAGFLATLGRRGIVLLIAKLKRLARNVALVCRPIEAGVEFIAADLQTVNKLTIHIPAAVAEKEARMTSARMNAALAAKARGILTCDPAPANRRSPPITWPPRSSSPRPGATPPKWRRSIA